MIIVNGKISYVKGKKVIDIDVGTLSHKDLEIVLEVLRGASEYVD